MSDRESDKPLDHACALLPTVAGGIVEEPMVMRLTRDAVSDLLDRISEVPAPQAGELPASAARSEETIYLETPAHERMSAILRETLDWCLEYQEATLVCEEALPDGDTRWVTEPTLSPSENTRWSTEATLNCGFFWVSWSFELFEGHGMVRTFTLYEDSLLRALLLTSPPSEVRGVFRALVRSEPITAARVLQRGVLFNGCPHRGRVIHGFLERDDWAPLLEDDDRSVRQTTIEALGRLDV